MKRFKVRMLSKDNQVFENYIHCNNRLEAIELTKEKLIDKGWDHYQYKLLSAEEVKGE